MNEKDLTRREFIKKGQKYLVGAAVASVTANLIDCRKSLNAYELKNKAEASTGTAVSIVKIKDGKIHAAVDEAIDLLGGMKEITQDKQRIMLKPNLLSENQCLPIPKGLSMIEAAALPETCFTVWSNVFDCAGLKPGESFLVHGGSSGIGTTAIQIAHTFKSTVFTTAGSDEKCQTCRNLGADVAINYRTEDFVEIILEKTDKKGVDVILDMVGGDYISRNIKVAATDGRIVNIAYLKGSTVEVNFMPVMLKRLTLTGSTLRPRSTKVKAAIAQALLKRVWPHIESGEIKPQIYRTFPLSEAAEAHRLMESSAHIGKIMLMVECY